jgi:hypothetical protein
MRATLPGPWVPHNDQSLEICIQQSVRTDAAGLYSVRRFGLEEGGASYLDSALGAGGRPHALLEIYVRQRGRRGEGHRVRVLLGVPHDSLQKFPQSRSYMIRPALSQLLIPEEIKPPNWSSPFCGTCVQGLEGLPGDMSRDQSCGVVTREGHDAADTSGAPIDDGAPAEATRDVAARDSQELCDAIPNRRALECESQ